LQNSQARRFEKQRRFWMKLIMAGMQKGEVMSDLDLETTVDEMLVEVHGLVTLQFVRPTAKMRTYARDRINAMIDRIMVVSK
jgi:hypothetical protein